MNIRGKLALLVPSGSESYLTSSSGMYSDDCVLLSQAISKIHTERMKRAIQKREAALDRETIPYLLIVGAGIKDEQSYVSQVEKEYEAEVESAKKFAPTNSADFKLWIRAGEPKSNYTLFMESFDWLLNAPISCGALPVFCVADGGLKSIASTDEVAQSFNHILMKVGPASRCLDKTRHAALIDYLTSRETTEVEIAFLRDVFESMG